MHTKNILLALIAATAIQCTPKTEPAETLRAPAYPLITIDPYTSLWSTTDNLYDAPTTHWTGATRGLVGVVTVDGRDYRVIGKEQPVYTPIVPNATVKPWKASYTLTEPEGEWFAADYNTAGWKEADAAFGSYDEPGVSTYWQGGPIWVRRVATIDSIPADKPVYLNYSHDDDAIIYVNGMKVVDTGNTCHKDVMVMLPDSVKATLVKGNNIIAAYCLDRQGLALLDFGLEYDESQGERFPETARQISAEVLPMNTIYNMECGPVEVTLNFTAPLFLDDLDLVSRPVNYISYTIKATDGKKHDIAVRFETTPDWALNSRVQKASTMSDSVDGLILLSAGNVDQKPLNRGGDDVRIDWGRFYMAADASAYKGEAGDHSLSLVRTVKDTGNADGYIMLGYDDIYAIQYFGENLRPYWNRNGDSTIAAQFAAAAAGYSDLMARADEFDKTLMANATTVGGEKYAALCALAYRQSVSAHKLVESPEGEVLFLSKENFSNGSIGTVDITYPSSPLYLLYNPLLLKGMMNPIFDYSENKGWNKPFPAHDVGTYPLANGQTYGGDMPVEESGNMLILMAAIAATEGNADYARAHWDVLTIWSDYLLENGLDPENQLCTDDFAGHFAHNTNLSIKAILGVASYGYLADMLGQKDVAEKYTSAAKEMAAQWEKNANDGDHYRLTFDQPGTWSQKYNLVWDNILHLGIFNPDITATELKYYLTKQNLYGLPLDSRETYTKTDWILWTATMAPDLATFEALVNPVYKFMDETTDRVPMSDWVYTDKPEQRGFQARSVVGGYYIKMLKEKLNQ